MEGREEASFAFFVVALSELLVGVVRSRPRSLHPARPIERRRGGKGV